jgi:hypothetical protein
MDQAYPSTSKRRKGREEACAGPALQYESLSPSPWIIKEILFSMERMTLSTRLLPTEYSVSTTRFWKPAKDSLQIPLSMASFLSLAFTAAKTFSIGLRSGERGGDLQLGKALTGDFRLRETYMMTPNVFISKPYAVM